MLVVTFFIRVITMRRNIFISFIFLLVLAGCHQFGGGVKVSSNQQRENLPPAHAPAYGRRSQFRYHYYPEAHFYFDVGRNLYFFLDSRGNWSVSARFPEYLRPYRQSRYVEIEMDSDTPYRKYSEHKKKYPPGQLKKNKKHKNKKHDDDEHPGRGRYRD